MKRAVTCVLLGLCISAVMASPVSDLSSLSPAVRAAAAQVLRNSYTPPPQTKWDSLITALKVGDRRTEVEAILKAHDIKSNVGGMRGAGLSSVDYRLDESWLLRCLYRYNIRHPEEDSLHARGLQLSPTWVQVNPPTNYTGVWIVYYINGEKCLETSLKAGSPYGERICYSYDGRKIYTEQHDPDKVEVGWTEYYHHSGGVKARGKRDKTGRPIGTWTNYNDDGSILGTHDWSKR